MTQTNHNAPTPGSSTHKAICCCDVSPELQRVLWCRDVLLQLVNQCVPTVMTTIHVQKIKHLICMITNLLKLLVAVSSHSAKCNTLIYN